LRQVPARSGPGRAGAPAPLARLLLAAWLPLAVLACAGRPAPEHPVSGPAPASRLDPEILRRVDALFATWDRPGSPGCALGVLSRGDFLLRRTWGEANLDHGIPITPETVFDLSSTSKQFTAAAVLWLAERGALSLDDPVGRHLPELPPALAPVTLAQLIHHTGGVRDFFQLMELAGIDLEDVITNEDILALLGRQRELNFPPGTERLYSNSGYVLLAEVVERVTGAPLSRFLADHFFGPLGMSHTHLDDDRHAVVPGRATAYRRSGDGFVMDHLWSFDAEGDGQVYTTLDDLARWERAFDQRELGARIAGPAFFAELTAPGPLAGGGLSDYAYGLQVAPVLGRMAARHGGSLAGFRTAVLRFPEEGLTVLCLCNVADAVAWDLAEEVAGLFLGPAPAAPPSSAPPVPSPAGEDLAPALGTFQGRLSRVVRRLEVGEGGELTFRDLGRGEATPLVALGSGHFRAADPAPSLELELEGAPDDPLLSARGRRLLARRPGHPEEIFDEIEQTVPPPEELRAWVGGWHSDELGADIEILPRGDGLVLRFGAGRESPLEVVSHRVLIAGSMVLELGSLREPGSRDSLRLSSTRVWNLRFERVAGPGLEPGKE